MKIKDWAEEDRPREKMLLKGVSALSDAELLAILLRTGYKDISAVQLAQTILSSVDNNLNTLGKMSIHDIKKGFKGIGQVKAIELLAALELGKRRNSNEVVKRQEIRSSHDVYNLFYPLLSDLCYEELWAIFTNRSARIIRKIKISQGGTNETSADIRIILKAAIEALASGIILCHNHPSGNIRPSVQDDTLTKRLSDSAKMMEIVLTDHIILSDGNYYSYADEGRLNK